MYRDGQSQILWIWGEKLCSLACCKQENTIFSPHIHITRGPPFRPSLFTFKENHVLHLFMQSWFSCALEWTYIQDFIKDCHGEGYESTIQHNVSLKSAVTGKFHLLKRHCLNVKDLWGEIEVVLLVLVDSPLISYIPKIFGYLTLSQYASLYVHKLGHPANQLLLNFKTIQWAQCFI